jgi:hypothetical protein
MRFTAETLPFIRLLELVMESESPSGYPASAACLISGTDRLAVVVNGTAAETEARVWQDGRCAVSAGALLGALRRSVRQPYIAVELRGRCLYVGDIPLASANPVSTELPATSLKIFLTTEMGIAPTDFPEDLLAAEVA